MDFPALRTYIAIYIQPAYQSTYALAFAFKEIISQQRRLVKHNLHTDKSHAISTICVSIYLYIKLTSVTSHTTPCRHQRIQQSTADKRQSTPIYSQPVNQIYTVLCLPVQHYACGYIQIVSYIYVRCPAIYTYGDIPICLYT